MKIKILESEERKIVAFFVTLLLILSLGFLFLEIITHIEFFLHLAAIPLEVLLAVFIVERFLAKRDYKKRRRQLMYIKSHLFRAEMRTLFIMNFKGLKSPPLTLLKIKNSGLEELRQMRKDAENIEYQSLETMESVIMEYVKAQNVWRHFLDRAISFDFEDIVEDMIYILHFIEDVQLFKENNPQELFVHQAAKREDLMKKVKKVLWDGIQKFLDYAVELKEKQPEMFEEIISDYVLCSQLCFPERGSSD